jgi:uncharacterized repeat protein (TIGR03803 family)
MKKLIIFLLLTFNYTLLTVFAQQYKLYGQTSEGGLFGKGVLFRFDPFSGKDTILLNLNGNNGSNQGTYLYLMANKILYGFTAYGGSNNDGVFFKYNLSTGIEDSIINFSGLNGSVPSSGIINGNNGLFYSTTHLGGKYGAGTIFAYNPVSNKDTVVFNFKGDSGRFSEAGLYLFNDTSIYGMATDGGLYSYGVIYKFNPLRNEYNVLYNFHGNNDGAYPQGTFIKDSNGLLYGFTGQLGSGGGGTLFSFNPNTNAFSTLVNFNGTNGKYPFGELFLATNGLLYGLTTVGGSKNDGVLFSYNVSMNSYNIVLNFDSINGAEPTASDVIEDTNNKILYGMTYYGGKYNKGVIFSYNLITNKDSVLLNFDGTNGSNPYGTLLLVPDSLLSIDEIRAKPDEVRVFPNPNNGNFTISLQGVQQKTQITVYNILGEQVYQCSLNATTTKIDLSNKAEGLYLYRVTTVTGELVGEGKFVIQ